GSDGDAMAAWAKARALRHQSGDVAGEMEALEGLGRATRRHLGEPSLASGYYREAAELAAASGDGRAEGRLRNTIAILEWSRAEYAEALAEYERALAIFRVSGDDAGLGLILNSLGATLRALGRPHDARERLVEALAVHRRTGERRLEGHALALLGEIALALDEWSEAVSRAEDSLAIRRATSDVRGEGWMLHLLARAHIARDRPDRARESLALAERAGAACSDVELLAECEQLRRSSGL
ncbi:MAG TPA: tetratricopeptide repeat protein, partial [Gemmatimonadaceae bacterium]|nr:tetratricopeptide repeat protein [Gemmatimonadaceae bacterium]